MNNLIFNSLTVKDFAEAFGTSEEEVLIYCGDLIKKADLKYRVCSQENREKIILDIIKKCDNKEFSVSGAHRKPDWSRGWGEILQEFINSERNLELLMPKDFRGDRPLRFKGNYIISNSISFEYDLWLIYKNWLFKKYFSNYENIYEFGCGTGHNLALLGAMFPDKKFFGMDWVPESQKILETISEKYSWKIEGIQFDLFSPRYDLNILQNSLVYTSAALEQLGNNYGNFLDYLLVKKPNLCINSECLAEYYDENSLFDYIALKYHKTRGYLSGFLTRLRELEKDKKIKIINTKRLGFGSLYQEVYMYVVWHIL